MTDSTIRDVTDTALWVATYRAEESERPDALFHDPLARKLAGTKGPAIARSMKTSRYTAWSVVTRTFIIDDFMAELLTKGVDTVLNLGAGLDTRPYRLKLPADLRWIEVDFPKMIEFKEAQLVDEKPRCRLERVKLDLSDRKARQDFFSKVSSSSKKVAVLTEGVIPYLSNDEVADLAADLRAQKNFKFWILDYFAPEVLRYLHDKKRQKVMRNAPFKFGTENWQAFFAERHWTPTEWRYLTLESLKRGRTPPAPWFFHLLRPFLPRKKLDEMARYSAYVILEPLT